jgi:hypothetical protein
LSSPLTLTSSSFSQLASVEVYERDEPELLELFLDPDVDLDLDEG